MSAARGFRVTPTPPAAAAASAAPAAPRTRIGDAATAPTSGHAGGTSALNPEP